MDKNFALEKFYDAIKREMAFTLATASYATASYATASYATASYATASYATSSNSVGVTMRLVSPVYYKGDVLFYTDRNSNSFEL